jgi:hypothetical protein
MFAPAPAYQPAMNYGQVQAAAAYGPAVAALDSAEALTYVQPVEMAYEQPAETDSGLFYATGGLLLVGAVASLAARSDQKSAVTEPDLEAAQSAAQVAMLFSSGRSSKPAAKGRGKPAAKGRGKPAAKGRASQPAPDDDLFVHEGTNGFQGDQLAFVYRAGLAQ